MIKPRLSSVGSRTREWIRHTGPPNRRCGSLKKWATLGRTDWPAWYLQSAGGATESSPIKQTSQVDFYQRPVCLYWPTSTEPHRFESDIGNYIACPFRNGFHLTIAFCGGNSDHNFSCRLFNRLSQVMFSYRFITFVNECDTIKPINRWEQSGSVCWSTSHPMQSFREMRTWQKARSKK